MDSTEYQAPKPRKPQLVGLRDVAAQAGIGIATASSVLNGSRSNTRVSQATRDRVLSAAKELGYHPNALARGLSGRPTKTLGVLFCLERASVAVANPYAFTVFQGLIGGAADAGYDITLFTEPWHDAERSGGILRSGRTDGVVLIAVTTDSDILASLAQTGLPAVAVSSSGGYNISSVDVDNSVGARLATEHLVSLGHRRIAHLSGDDNLISAIERREAFLATLTEASLPVPSDYLLPGSYETASGYDRTRRLLALPAPPTAIFASNDTLALAAINAARDCGVDVPGQLSVIGFDDLPTLSLEALGLTTIRQPLMEIGRMGSLMLIASIETGSVQPERRLFTPELIVRNSTAPPA
ncbi:MAG: LacI family DNA-binding transcriptional regulator [Janthinobacterium lividum]